MSKNQIPELDNRKLLESWGLYQVQKNEENELGFFKELKTALFLVPVKAAEDRPKTAPPVQIMLLRTPEEESFIPAFTDRSELEKWPFVKEAVAVISYDGLKNHVVENAAGIDGLVINAFGGNLVLRRKELELIDSKTEGMSVKRAEHRGELRIFQPAAFPEGMLDALERFCCGEPAIHKAYAVMTQGENEEKAHWLFLLEFDGEKSKIFPKAAEVIKDFMEPGSSFEMMKAVPELAWNAADKIMPVYEEHAVPIA